MLPSSVEGVIDGHYGAELESSSDGWPSFRDLPSVGILRQHLAWDACSSGTRADLSELDQAATNTNASINFFESVSHVAPFFPSMLSIDEGPPAQSNRFIGTGSHGVDGPRLMQWSDESFVLHQVAKRGRDLQYAALELRSNLELVKVAMQTHASSFWFASADVQQHEEVLSIAAAKCYNVSMAPAWDRMTDGEQTSQLEVCSMEDNNKESASAKVLQLAAVIAKHTEGAVAKPRWSGTATARSRLRSEFRALHLHPLPNSSIQAAEQNTWEVNILGPPATPYAAERLSVNLHFPDNYPLEPPQVRFITKIEHGLVDETGLLSLDILDMDVAPVVDGNVPFQTGWSVLYDGASVLHAVLAILAQPHLDHHQLQKIAFEALIYSINKRRLAFEQEKLEFPFGKKPLDRFRTALAEAEEKVQMHQQKRVKLGKRKKVRKGNEDCLFTKLFTHPHGYVPQRCDSRHQIFRAWMPFFDEFGCRI